MAQKSKTQQAVLKHHKMWPLFWAVVEELDRHMIVKNRITGEFRVISK